MQSKGTKGDITMNETQIQKLNVMSALFDMMALLQDVPSLQTLQDIGILGLRITREIKEINDKKQTRA